MRKAVYFPAKALVVLLLLFLTASMAAYAAEEGDETKYYLGSAVNAGKDTGFSESNQITEDDPHFGWTLGNFYVDGFTRDTENADGDPVFLKTVGDTVTLWFELNQDIAKLNGNDRLCICEDANGYDEYFGIEKTNMGRGTLVIRHIDYQNRAGDPVIYTDYLAANATRGAAVEVKLCEEGDYEVALNYEIRRDRFDIFGWNPLPSHYNYRIFFRFSVRNGNCMVYPFDVATGAELTNSSITENGFYLDLAKSRYLNIDIKKEVRKEGAEGLTEDIRFNKPAKDGEQYTDEGIYTITVSNRYTNQTTTKVIYVGTDDVLKAHVTTGRSIDEVERLLSAGATVAADGTLISASGQTMPLAEETAPSDVTEQQEAPVDDKMEEEPSPQEHTSEQSMPVQSGVFVAGGVLLAAILVACIVIRKRRKATASKLEENVDEQGGGEK